MAEPQSNHSAPAITIREARNLEDMRAIMQVRHEVFVVEQGVATLVSSDPQDRAAYHVVGEVDGHIVGVGRLARHGDEGQIAWVAVLPHYRHLGVGRGIMQELLRYGDERGLRSIVLNAQTHALRFYLHLSFEPVNGVFMMSGIEHQMMVRHAPGEQNVRY